MTRPPSLSSSNPHNSSPSTPRSHAPSTNSNAQRLAAPVKASGGRGFSDTDGDLDSPSKSGEKVARKKGRAVSRKKSVSEGSLSDEGAWPDTPPRRLSVSLTFTPIRKSGEDTSAPASLSKQQQEFESAMQTSNSKAQTYVAPHRRSAPQPITPVSYSPDHLSHYDRSNLPPSEDRYYVSPQQRRGSVPLLSAFSSYNTSPAHTPASRPTAGSSKYHADSPPPPTPPAAIISRRPYEESATHHPVAIPEELESVSSWAEEVERHDQELALPDHEDDEAFYSPMPWPEKTTVAERRGSAEEDDLEFLVRIGKRKGSMAFVTNSGIDVPSPVWEEHFDEDDIKIPRKASIVSTARKVSIGGATVRTDEGSTGQESVCTGCGTAPVPSFVALVPCDHLVCHNCLNALVNATAHKPPRPMACFACEAAIKSFLPAWEGVGAAGGGRIGLVEALHESIRNGDDRKKATVEKTDSPRKSRRGKKGSRARLISTTVSTDLINSLRDRTNDGDVQFDVEIVEKRRASTSSTGSLAGHGSHLLSPLSLKSKKSQSVMASGSLSQVEYSASISPSTPSKSRQGRRSRSHSVSAPVSKESTPARRSSNARRSKESRNSLSTDTGTPDLSNTSFTPFKSVELDEDGSPPSTPGDGPDARLAMIASPSRGWEVLQSIKAAQSVKVRLSPEEDSVLEWSVVRLDNIPWDVTVAEIEDWLPSASLPPIEKCVMAVHILCNRSDGRTLNQCYVETVSVSAARSIVRSRDGQKLRRRPVHATLSSQGELLTTLFPTYDPGFTGLIANRGPTPCPLLMQTELTGLLSLCKLESPHACKVKERPYFNIISIVQKFPWDQPETWNSQQVMRLFNTMCAAIEFLNVVREVVPDCEEILNAFVEVIIACPGFRAQQKVKLLRKTGLDQSRYPTFASPKRHSISHSFSFSPPSMRANYVTVSKAGLVEQGSTNPAALLAFAPSGGISPFSSPEGSSKRISKTVSAPNFFSTRISDIAKQLGVDDSLVKAVAEQPSSF